MDRHPFIDAAIFFGGLVLVPIVFIGLSVGILILAIVIS